MVLLARQLSRVGVTHCLDPAVMWDGYHCHFVQCLAQARRWEDLKQHIDTMGETYLRELMQRLFSLSPRLYQTLWGEHVVE